MEIGGIQSMVAGAVLSGLLLAGVAVVAQRRTGWVAAWSWCGLVWWLVVIALVTLVPLYGIDLAVPGRDPLGDLLAGLRRPGA